MVGVAAAALTACSGSGDKLLDLYEDANDRMEQVDDIADYYEILDNVAENGTPLLDAYRLDSAEWAVENGHHVTANSISLARSRYEHAYMRKYYELLKAEKDSTTYNPLGAQ